MSAVAVTHTNTHTYTPTQTDTHAHSIIPLERKGLVSITLYYKYLKNGFLFYYALAEREKEIAGYKEAE